MKKNTRILTILICFVISYSCLAKISKSEFDNSLDKPITAMMEQNHIPGVAVGISFQNGNTICKYYGKSNLEYDAPVTKESTFAIGSITKTFTAIAILKLCQEGKLSLDTKLSKFYPKFPDSNEITIKELLDHSSGIRDIFQIKKLMNFVAHPWSPQQVISMATKAPFNFKPGTAFEYNNTAFIILGVIIEKVTGKHYEKYISETILNPLYMSDTYMGNHSKIVKYKVSGYEYHNKNLINTMYVNNSWIWSAGGLYSNVQNILKLKTVFDDKKILDKNSIKKMFTPSREPGKNRFSEYKTFYGLGITMMKLPSWTLVGKEGGMSGFTAYLCYLQKENILFIIMCNLDGQNHKLVNVTTQLLPIIISYNKTFQQTS